MAKKKVAIVLSGGASFGAYIAGAIEELLVAFRHSDAYEIDIVTGSSAGGITSALVTHGLLYTAGTTALAEVWLDKMDIVDMLAPELFDEPFSLLNIHPLMQEARKLISWPADQQPARAAFCAPTLTLSLPITNESLLPYVSAFAQPAAGRTEPYVQYRATEQETFYFGPTAVPTDPIWARLADVTQATAAIPFVFPPVRLQRSADPSHGDQQYIERPNFQGDAYFWYVDGGIFNGLPVDLAWYHANKQPEDLAERVILVVNPWRATTDPPPLDPHERGVLGRLFNFLSIMYAESEAFQFQRGVIAPATAPAAADDTRSLEGVDRPPEELLNRFALVMPLPGHPLRGGQLTALSGFFDRRFREYNYRRGAADGQRLARTLLQIDYPAPQPAAYYDPDGDARLDVDLTTYAGLAHIPSTRDPRRSVQQVFEDALDGRIKALLHHWNLPGPDALLDIPLAALIKHEVLREIAATWK
ncbi:MAG TPA: patatin-like phospholipase family protein [Chloroflexia bacterium]|nr:patatin-like phospholipase family protein [Chloroflexia bacterium]